MAITVRPNPAQLSWANFTPVPTLPEPRNAVIDFSFNVQNRPVRNTGGVFQLAETLEITVSPRVARVLRTGSRTPALLAHEQGHLDIALCVAWALAAQLQTLSAPDQGALRTALNNAYSVHVDDRLRRVQEGYDLWTNHGRDAAQQTMWLSAIATALSTHAATLQNYTL